MNLETWFGPNLDFCISPSSEGVEKNFAALNLSEIIFPIDWWLFQKCSASFYHDFHQFCSKIHLKPLRTPNVKCLTTSYRTPAYPILFTVAPSLGGVTRSSAPKIKVKITYRRVAVKFRVPLLVGETKSMKMSVSVYREFDALKTRFCSHLVSGPKWSQKSN